MHLSKWCKAREQSKNKTTAKPQKQNYSQTQQINQAHFLIIWRCFSKLKKSKAQRNSKRKYKKVGISERKFSPHLQKKQRRAKLKHIQAISEASSLIIYEIQNIVEMYCKWQRIVGLKHTPLFHFKMQISQRKLIWTVKHQNYSRI